MKWVTRSRGLAIKGAHIGRDGAEDGAAKRPQPAGLPQVGLLKLPEVARRRMAIADVRNVRDRREPLDDAGVRAEEEIGSGIHAQIADGQREERQEGFVPARPLREALEKRFVDGVRADQFAQVRAVRDQCIDGRAGKEQAELLEHFFAAAHPDEPVMRQGDARGLRGDITLSTPRRDI